ncbi:MAG: twin-arginine translocase subunit TatC [Jatrophihabitans sp.]|uniref:twin-arginine translocase subunit TatC n=1 Tax=Jatrophihabitans sp. TaxID=1932789 RepID=UPI0039167694
MRRRRVKNPDGRMPVLDHLRELRRRLIIIVLLVAAGAVLGWYLYPHTLNVLRHPYCSVPEKFRYTPSRSTNCVLIYHGALDGFITRLKVSVISGAVFTGPFWLYQVWAFITPGLRKNERKYTLIFVIASTILFAAGMALAYVVLSKGLRILLEQAGNGTQAQLTVSDYISFVTLMLVVFGAAFELPLLVVMANVAGVLPARLLRRSRRIAIFLIFLFAAVATPSTDPFTMCAMALPMVVLFEVAIQIAIVHDRRKARRQAEERAEQHLDDDVPSAVDAIPERLDWSDST